MLLHVHSHISTLIVCVLRNQSCRTVPVAHTACPIWLGRIGKILLLSICYLGFQSESCRMMVSTCGRLVPKPHDLVLMSSTPMLQLARKGYRHHRSMLIIGDKVPQT